ncbi:MAG: SPOR domain-containing protein [Bacteroidetes bacterium]|nr:SPOR domain-containing protein [Bacteroidota bacterium]
MSKIDYITIAVVVVCISLLGLVFWKVADLNWTEENNLKTEDPILVNEEEEAAPFLDENYNVTDFTEEDTMPLKNEEKPILTQKPEKVIEKSIVKETVAPVKTEPKAENTTPVPTIKEEYLVWGGSFSTRAGAEEEQAKFKKLGYTQAEVSLFDKGKYAVVIVGRYPTQTEAQALVNELKTKHNISAIAKKKKL